MVPSWSLGTCASGSCTPTSPPRPPCPDPQAAVLPETPFPLSLTQESQPGPHATAPALPSPHTRHSGLSSKLLTRTCGHQALAACPPVSRAPCPGLILFLGLVPLFSHRASCCGPWWEKRGGRLCSCLLLTPLWSSSLTIPPPCLGRSSSE